MATTRLAVEASRPPAAALQCHRYERGALLLVLLRADVGAKEGKQQPSQPHARSSFLGGKSAADAWTNYLTRHRDPRHRPRGDVARARLLTATGLRETAPLRSKSAAIAAQHT